MNKNPQMIISGCVKGSISLLLSADEDDTIDIQDGSKDEVYVEVNNDPELEFE